MEGRIKIELFGMENNKDKEEEEAETKKGTVT